MTKLIACIAGVAIFSTLLVALDEKELTTKMKSAGAAFGAARKAAGAQSMSDVAMHAKHLAEALDGTEGFFKEHSMADAATWSKEGTAAAMSLAKAAEANDADGVRTAMGKVGGSCKSCHDVHREKLADGTYKMK